MPKTLFAASVVLLAFAAGAARASSPDFRHAIWGMTQAQVLASETGKPAEVRENSGEAIVRYDSLTFAGLHCRAVYIFAGNKLVRAKYLFDAEHSDENDFISDYKMIEPVLQEAYGKPESSRAFWGSDLYQQEPKSYLDQDRAAPSEILPSDRFVGLAVAEGSLKLYTQWTAGGTKILHGLTGQDHHIIHQIEYRAVEWEELESEVRGAAAERF